MKGNLKGGATEGGNQDYQNLFLILSLAQQMVWTGTNFMLAQATVVRTKR
jgi:hypothetical protein